MNQVVDIIWTEDKVAELKRLWLVEGLSCSRVAAALGPGFTRNSVIGKLHRLKINRAGGSARIIPDKPKKGVGSPGQPNAAGIRKRLEKRRHEAARRAHAVEAEPESRKLLKSEIWQPLDGCVPLPIEALGRQDCRWPLGDPLVKGFGYCGLPRAGEHTSYCPVHHSVATGGPA